MRKYKFNEMDRDSQETLADEIRLDPNFMAWVVKDFDKKVRDRVIVESRKAKLLVLDPNTFDYVSENDAWFKHLGFNTDAIRGYVKDEFAEDADRIMSLLVIDQSYDKMGQALPTVDVKEVIEDAETADLAENMGDVIAQGVFELLMKDLTDVMDSIVFFMRETEREYYDDDAVARYCYINDIEFIKDDDGFKLA